jgi:hypothetical protein
MPLGPVQVLIASFAGDRFSGEIAAELERLMEHDTVRVLDLLFVAKAADGTLTILEEDERPALATDHSGELATGLFGAEDEDAAAQAADDDVWYLADAIPPATAACIAVIEHRWATPLRDAIARAGATHVAAEWIAPEDLAALGVDGG